MLQSSKLLSVFKPDTLSGVLTLFNDHNLSYSRTSSGDRSQRTLWSCSHQLKYLGYLKLIGSGYNWCHWLPIRWDPCGALNLDVQDVYANGCTVNGTVHPSHTRGVKGGTSILISIEVISCFGAREYTSWNLNLLWSVGKLGSTDVNSNAALHGETILALWDLICYFKCILNFEI